MRRYNEIWKFPLGVPGGPGDGLALISMPEGAQVLTIQMQEEQPVIWAIVDPSAKPELRKFIIYGTGWSMDERFGRYVGTFQMWDGALVWHVFEPADVVRTGVGG